MYEVIADFERGTRAHRIARVDTKYKTMDRKVKPVAAPLPEGSWERIKGVATDPSLRDPAGIAHSFTDKTLRELKIDGVASYCQWKRIGSEGFSKGMERPSHSHQERSGASTRPSSSQW